MLHLLAALLAALAVGSATVEPPTPSGPYEPYVTLRFRTDADELRTLLLLGGDLEQSTATPSPDWVVIEQARTPAVLFDRSLNGELAQVGWGGHPWTESLRLRLHSDQGEDSAFVYDTIRFDAAADPAVLAALAADLGRGGVELAPVRRVLLSEGLTEERFADRLLLETLRWSEALVVIQVEPADPLEWADYEELSLLERVAADRPFHRARVEQVIFGDVTVGEDFEVSLDALDTLGLSGDFIDACPRPCRLLVPARIGPSHEPGIERRLMPFHSISWIGRLDGGQIFIHGPTKDLVAPREGHFNGRWSWPEKLVPMSTTAVLDALEGRVDRLFPCVHIYTTVGNGLLLSTFESAPNSSDMPHGTPLLEDPETVVALSRLADTGGLDQLPTWGPSGVHSTTSLMRRDGVWRVAPPNSLARQEAWRSLVGLHATESIRSLLVGHAGARGSARSEK